MVVTGLRLNKSGFGQRMDRTDWKFLSDLFSDIMLFQFGLNSCSSLVKVTFGIQKSKLDTEVHFDGS